MAKNWDKIKDKMAQGFGGPQPSDWRQMAEQLDAHPRFRKKPPRFGWLGAGLLLLLLAIPLFWWLSPSPTASPNPPAHSPNSAGESAAQLSTHPQRAASDDDWGGKKTKQRASYPTVEPDASPTSKTLANSPAAKNQTTAQEQAHKAPSVAQQAAAQKGSLPIATPGSSAGASAQKAPQKNQSQATANTVDTTASRPPASPHFPVQVPVAGLRPKNWHSLLPAFKERFSPEASPALEAQLPLSGASNIIDPATGFRLSGLSFTGEAMALFGPRPNAAPDRSVEYYATGGGVALHWRRQNWGLHLGLCYRQQWPNFTSSGGYLRDSTRLTGLVPREELQINSVWVIDSLYHGRWVNDTMRFTRTDTAEVYLHDSTAQSPRRGAVEHYLELPIYTSYRWDWGTWWLELGGGLVLSHWRSAGSENATSQMGLHVMLQPQVGYRFHPRWSAVGRLHTRYAMRQPFPQRQPWVGALQLGVHFHF